MHSIARPSAFLAAVAFAAVACQANQSDADKGKTATTPVEWHDPASHTVQFVTVPGGARIEVVDWGGQGEPLVLIAGLGDAAHMYDDFAPRLTNAFHVLGVTRRGYGASGRPDTGYTVATLSNDVYAVLDSLHLARVDLAGHSIAGQELTWIAAHHPDRVHKLVYLDAGFDYHAHPVAKGFPDAPKPTAADSASPTAGLAYARRISGAPYPEAAFRATERFDSSGRDLGLLTPDSIDAKIIVSSENTPPALNKVHGPTLAIYDRDTSIASVFPYLSPSDSVAQRWFHTLQDWRRAQKREFRARVPQATIVELKGAGHYVFLTQPDTVEHLMRGFLTAKP
jgi:pimeloyl-ACP methyl ester carboxylesterase